MSLSLLKSAAIPSSLYISAALCLKALVNAEGRRDTQRPFSVCAKSFRNYQKRGTSTYEWQNRRFHHTTFFRLGSTPLRRSPVPSLAAVKPAFSTCSPELRAGRAASCGSGSFHSSRPGSTGGSARDCPLTER